MKVTLKKPYKCKKGFTLLEVMVALAIISISLVTLLHSQSSNISRIYNSTALTRAALIGKKIIYELDSNGTIDNGEWEGEEELGRTLFSWKKKIEPSMIEDFAKVTVAVSWGDKTGAAPFVIETYRIL